MSTNRPFTQALRVSAIFVLVAGVVFSTFSGGNPTSVRAQEAVTTTPAPEVMETVLPPAEESDISELFTSAQNPYQAPYAQLRNFPLTLGQNSVTAPVALGEPGLSYRYVRTFGTTGEPYLEDGTHINGPDGVFIDELNNLYTAETIGNRLLRFNASGANTLIIGHAGQPWHHDDFLSAPKDIAVDNSGNIWVVIEPAIKEFDSSGNLIQIFPETNPWESGDANDRFNGPKSIAFDSNGFMYISDTYNHRIQVYDVSGGSPSFVETIGETGISHDDNNGFNEPAQIAFDSLDRLYVVDTANYRVQRCTNSSGWSCEPFYGETGVPGNDLNHMEWSFGITVKNDNVFIADGANYRVLKCNTTGTCSHFAGTTGSRGWSNSQFWWPAAIAVDSSNNVYVSDQNNDRIQKFNSGGTYLRTIGVTRVPYLTNASRFNSPWGIAVASDGSIYFTENRGYRLIKMSSAGNQLWTVGTPGVFGYTNNKFGDWWAGLEGNPAIATNGRIFVTDTANSRVQIFNSNGSYFATLGTGNWGTGEYDFACPRGAAISPVNGDVYIVDGCNHRIQVFTSNLVYKATIGEAGVEGDDNSHFKGPWGVAVSSNGDIFVADTDNYRIQKCNFTSGVNYTCSTFAGETGIWTEGSFDHIYPVSVAVGSNNRVYVVDNWSNRIQVYDSSGAYLTTIGGEWSDRTGGFISPTGVAVDNNGNVYVADRDNHRIQKFASGVPGWVQVNINGFGDGCNYAVESLEIFNDTLYAGASNYTEGATIWRSYDGTTWDTVIEPGFGNGYGNTNSALFDMVEFSGQLYAGTGWWVGDGVGGQIWRSSTGDSGDWTLIEGDGFGNSDNSGVTSLGVFANMIYATTFNSATGFELWRSSTGNSSSWSAVATLGFGRGAENHNATGLAVFNNQLYVAVEASPGVGAQVWRSSTGNSGDWTQVSADGFGTVDNFQTGGFAVLNGYLYVGTRNDASGAEIWRTADGTTWSKVAGNGFGDVNNYKIEALMPWNDVLYAVTDNGVTGLEVWRSANGSNWSQINLDGFGSSSNHGTLWSNAIIGFENDLFLGTSGAYGQIWKYLRPVVANINTITDTGDGTLSEGEQVIVPVTKLTVTFNKDVNPPVKSNFILKKGTTIITINSVSYDSLTRTVTLNINDGKKLPFGKYTLTIKKNISDTENNLMDNNFIRRFSLVKPPSVPSLISPINNVLVTKPQPKLDWSNSTVPAGTVFDHYQVQLATDLAFTVPLDEDTLTSEFTPAAPLTADTKYYWRVRTFNTLGQASAWSKVGTFRQAILPPDLISPANGDPAGTRKPTFDWTDVANNSGYVIQVSASPNFGTLLINTSVGTNISTFTSTINLPSGKTLYWRVRTKGTNGPSAWSTPVFSFTTP